MKNIIIISILTILSMYSCQRGCTSVKRSLQTVDRDYTIVLFSGGDTVFVDSFRGIVNNSKESDGIYYYKNGQLIEVSGDYVIKSK